MEAPNTQVYVTNISPSASEKTVTDFFSFCGKINSMTLRTLEGGTKEAVIEFQTDAAAKTALLLTNALIVDRPIAVVPYTGPAQQSDEQVSHESKVDADEIQQQHHTVPDQERTKTSVIASLLAAGYSLGADAVDKARSYDEEHGLSQTIMGKAQQINEQYKIGQTASAWSSAAYSWWSGVDQSLGISQTASAIKESGSAAARAVSESEAMQAANETLEVTKEALVSAADAMRASTSRLIEEQPVLKVATTKIQQGTEAVRGELRHVVDDTSRLIRERDQAKRPGPFDGINEKAAPAAPAAPASAPSTATASSPTTTTIAAAAAAQQPPVAQDTGLL